VTGLSFATCQLGTGDWSLTSSLFPLDFWVDSFSISSVFLEWLMAYAQIPVVVNCLMYYEAAVR